MQGVLNNMTVITAIIDRIFKLLDNIVFIYKIYLQAMFSLFAEKEINKLSTANKNVGRGRR